LNMIELRSKRSKGLEVPCQNTFKDKPAFIKRRIKVLVAKSFSEAKMRELRFHWAHGKAGLGHGHGHGHGHGYLRMRSTFLSTCHKSHKVAGWQRKLVRRESLNWMLNTRALPQNMTAQSPIVIISDDESGNS